LQVFTLFDFILEMPWCRWKHFPEPG